MLVQLFSRNIKKSVELCPISLCPSLNYIVSVKKIFLLKLRKLYFERIVFELKLTTSNVSTAVNEKRRPRGSYGAWDIMRTCNDKNIYTQCWQDLRSDGEET